MSPMTRRAAVRSLALGVLAVACGRSPAVPMPEDVVLGRDECAWCRMLIDEPRLPAEFARRNGTVEKFGEPGCLLAWLDRKRSVEGTSFVTVEDGAWMSAGEARFLVGVRRTPMTFDVTAHRVAPAAGSLSWAEMLQKGAPVVRSS